MRRVSILVAVVVSVVLLGPPAGAQTVLGRAAQQLRSDKVYVDPDAERRISDGAERDLEAKIRNAQTPIFIAILPASATAEAGGNANAVPGALARTVGLAGTYAVIAGTSFRADSDTLSGAPGIATAVFDRSKSTEEVLSDFITRADQLATRGGAATGNGSSGGNDSGGSDGGGGSGVLPLLLLIGAGGGGFYLWRRGKVRRAEEERQEANDRQVLQAEMSVLGEDVMALEPHISLVPDAREDYEAGVSRYRSAQAALDYADDPVDLVRVGRVIAEGRYAMTRARARIEGREPPPPPEELRRPGRHDEPALDVDETGQPVYVGYPGGFYGGGGWFGGGGGGGLLTGLLLGQMLGGGFGWGGGWGGGYGHGGHDSGDGGDGGGGDWGGGGGGDWGGGGFGGGDFGGDVGGGDW
jgi:hypothetical protein